MADCCGLIQPINYGYFKIKTIRAAQVNLTCKKAALDRTLHCSKTLTSECDTSHEMILLHPQSKKLCLFLCRVSVSVFFREPACSACSRFSGYFGFVKMMVTCLTRGPC